MSSQVFDPSREDSRDILLIVDDSELNRTILRTAFEPFYQIEEAADGEEGLQKILKNRANLCAVLLDVVMPKKSGLEALYEMRKDGLQSEIPVFLVTAEPNHQITREAYDLGVMDVIGKPVVPFVVKRRVQSVVELFRARKLLGRKVEKQQEEILQQAEKIVDLSFGLVEALSTAIEFRSGESGEHVRRIHDITELMLRKTKFGKGIDPEQIEWISLAAVMHDVGKIAIPDAILNKPGRLTHEEYEIMKTHAIRGYEMLQKVPRMRGHGAYAYACDIARHHHERWDGSGYPDGLSGDAISPWAQIVSIADVYDALVSSRVYKGAFSAEQAVQMIRRGECGAFNPELLREFLLVEEEIRLLYQKKDA